MQIKQIQRIQNFYDNANRDPLFYTFNNQKQCLTHTIHYFAILKPCSSLSTTHPTHNLDLIHPHIKP